ncbi:MAG: hypothetical protein Q7R95_01430 [bacterium]|nr:hypothetical protein [bacterium]
MGKERIEEISKLLLEEISERFDNEPINIRDLEFSESFSEILDRFIILHIRIWKMEDAISWAKSDSEKVELKRKIDYCNRDRRPKLIRAINFFLDTYVDKNHHKKFSEENIKMYSEIKKESI